MSKSWGKQCTYCFSLVEIKGYVNKGWQMCSAVNFHTLMSLAHSVISSIVDISDPLARGTALGDSSKMPASINTRSSHSTDSCRFGVRQTWYGEFSKTHSKFLEWNLLLENCTHINTDRTGDWQEPSKLNHWMVFFVPPPPPRWFAGMSQPKLI